MSKKRKVDDVQSESKKITILHQVELEGIAIVFKGPTSSHSGHTFNFSSRTNDNIDVKLSSEKYIGRLNKATEKFETRHLVEQKHKSNIPGISIGFVRKSLCEDDDAINTYAVITFEVATTNGLKFFACVFRRKSYRPEDKYFNIDIETIQFLYLDNIICDTSGTMIDLFESKLNKNICHTMEKASTIRIVKLYKTSGFLKMDMENVMTIASDTAGSIVNPFTGNLSIKFKFKEEEYKENELSATIDNWGPLKNPGPNGEQLFTIHFQIPQLQAQYYTYRYGNISITSRVSIETKLGALQRLNTNILDTPIQ